MAISASSITKSNTLEQLRTQFNNLVSDLTALEAGKVAFTEITTTTQNVTNVNVAEDGTIVFEGATADAFETTLTVADPTADRTITLPNTTGTVVVSGDGGFTVADGGTVGSTSATSAMTIAASGIVTFVDDILIKDGGTIGNASVADVMTLASTGIVTFKDDIVIKDGGTIGTGTTAAAITIAAGGDVTLSGDLTISGDDITMATNTSGNLLVADGTNFNSVAVGDLSEISTIASDDVFLAVDTSGGGLKKVARSTVVSGLATSSAISNVVEDTTPQLGGDLDGQGNNLDDIGTIDAEAFSHSYGATGSPVTFTVTVGSTSAAHPYNGDGSSSKYLIDGVIGAAPILGGFDATTADSEYFYKFDQADSSNSGHPLRFYLDADKTVAYTTGVTTSGSPGSSGAHTTIQINEETPRVLYYQCSSHALMGNYILMPQSNVSNSFEKLIAMPTHDSGTLKIDGTVLMDASDGSETDAGDHIVQNTSANENDNILLEDGMHDPVGVLTSHGVTFSGTSLDATTITTSGNLSVGGNLDVTGTFDLSDSNFTNAGDIQLDSITGDGDTDTSITFSGSDVITIATGGTTAATFNASQILTLADDLIIKDGGTIGATSAATAITIASSGIVSFVDDITIKDGGTIGTATDADSITIASAGAVTFSQTSVHSASLSVKNGATSAGFIEFFEDSDNGTNKVTLIGPASTSDVTLTLPATTDTVAVAGDITALAIALG